MLLLVPSMCIAKEIEEFIGIFDQPHSTSHTVLMFVGGELTNNKLAAYVPRCLDCFKQGHYITAKNNHC